MFSIKTYNDSYKVDWNNFVDISKNSTFLFKREFMDYHAGKYTQSPYYNYKYCCKETSHTICNSSMRNQIIGQLTLFGKIWPIDKWHIYDNYKCWGCKLITLSDNHLQTLIYYLPVESEIDLVSACSLWASSKSR